MDEKKLLEAAEIQNKIKELEAFIISFEAEINYLKEEKTLYLWRKCKEGGEAQVAINSKYQKQIKSGFEMILIFNIIKMKEEIILLKKEFKNL